jgi:hypothetical protein
MGFSPATMKVLENVYWVATPFLLGIGVYITWKQNKQIEAVLLTIIGLAAIFYYWIKWFKIKSKDDVWPPFISSCPDYLTLVSPQTTGDNEPVCMDFVGVSRQPLVLKKAKVDQIPQSGDSDFESFVFRLGKRAPTQTPEDFNKTLCLKVTSKGLSWAGVCE